MQGIRRVIQIRERIKQTIRDIKFPLLCKTPSLEKCQGLSWGSPSLKTNTCHPGRDD